jgi:hypothetical protein
LDYLTGGIGSLDALKGDGVSDGVFLKALEHLQESGQDTGPLEQWVHQNVDLSTPGRGRPAPTVGNERIYKAQRLKEEGSPFIRLPVDLLGCRKGSPVKVIFEENRFIVERVND